MICTAGVLLAIAGAVVVALWPKPRKRKPQHTPEGFEDNSIL